MSCHSVTCVKAAAGKALDGCDGNAGKRSQHIIISAATEFHKKKRARKNPPPRSCFFTFLTSFPFFYLNENPTSVDYASTSARAGWGGRGGGVGGGVVSEPVFGVSIITSTLFQLVHTLHTCSRRLRKKSSTFLF